jgi:hypothetical protein
MIDYNLSSLPIKRIYHWTMEWMSTRRRPAAHPCSRIGPQDGIQRVNNQANRPLILKRRKRSCASQPRIIASNTLAKISERLPPRTTLPSTLLRLSFFTFKLFGVVVVCGGSSLCLSSSHRFALGVLNKRTNTIQFIPIPSIYSMEQSIVGYEPKMPADLSVRNTSQCAAWKGSLHGLYFIVF